MGTMRRPVSAASSAAVSVQRLPAPRDYGNVHAFEPQLPRYGFAYAAAAAGDYRRPYLKLQVHQLFLPNVQTLDSPQYSIP